MVEITLERSKGLWRVLQLMERLTIMYGLKI